MQAQKIPDLDSRGPGGVAKLSEEDAYAIPIGLRQAARLSTCLFRNDGRVGA